MKSFSLWDAGLAAQLLALLALISWPIFGWAPPEIHHNNSVPAVVARYTPPQGQNLRLRPPQAPARVNIPAPTATPSRGNSGALVWVTVTAYTAGMESTGKVPGDPGYGITASGTRARAHHTVAMNGLPFGARVFIPKFGRWYIVEDRIGYGTDLDIYMDSLSLARKFGRQRLRVIVED